jgi:hypothetical protein
MRYALLSILTIGLLFIGSTPALAKDPGQVKLAVINNPTNSAAVNQSLITPVRWYAYYGGPGWYRGYYYPRYRGYNYSVRPYPYRYWSYYGPAYGYYGYGYRPFGFNYYGPRVGFRFGVYR